MPGLPPVAASGAHSLAAVHGPLVAVVSVVPASAVAASWLGCAAACEILLDQGLGPCLLGWQVDS